MKQQQVMEQAEQALYKIYNRFPVVFDHGDGVILTDADGTDYLDFGAGIAVMGLGYNYPGFNDAVKAQIDKLYHISNLFYSEPMAEAGQKLLKASDRKSVV